MKRLIFVLLLTISVLFPGCRPQSVNPRRVAAVLDDVETYINERPDSALAVLECLDTNLIHTNKTKAHYYLLLGIAKDKNYRDDGTEIRGLELAESWYSLHGNSYDRLRTYYYLADQQSDAGRVVEASVNYSRALDLAEVQEEWFFAGMAARNLSTIFSDCYDYYQSVYYARKSVQSFQRVARPQYALYSKMQLANGLFNTQEYDMCISLCDSLIQEADEFGDKGIVADALSTSAKVYVNREPSVPDSTIMRLERLRTIYPLRSSQCSVYAWALFLQGETGRARDLIKEAYMSAKNLKDSCHVMLWDQKIAEGLKDYVSASSLLSKMQEYTDEQLHLSVLNSVEKARAQYYNEQKIILAEKILRDRWTKVYVLLLAVLLSLIVFSFYRNRALKAEQQVREQTVRLEEKDKANEELSKKLSLYGTTVGETLDFGFDILNRLSDAYYHPNTDNEKTYHNIIKEYLLDVSSRTRLGDSIETNINIIHDDVLAKLRAEVPGLKEEDFKLFSFCLFGFSYKAINALSPRSSSINTSYSRVFRLRKAIEKSGSNYTDFFLSFLEKGVSKNG